MPRYFRNLVTSLPLAAILVGAPSLARAGSPVDHELTWVSCPGAGLEFGATVVPAPRAVVGLVVEDSTIGVVTSMWVALPDGTPVMELWSRPGDGLAKNTVWCYWPWEGVPTGHIGAYLLLSDRPS